MLRFKAPGYEAAFMEDREKGSSRPSGHLQMFLTGCWFLGFFKYALPLLFAEMVSKTRIRYALIVCLQCLMVPLHALGAYQFHYMSCSLKGGLCIMYEDLKMWYTLAEMTANMVCTILDDNAVRQISMSWFGPPIMGPILQGWFPIVDMIRLSAHLPLQMLRFLSFAWMELDALIRLQKQGVGMPALRGMLTYDVTVMLVAAILLPIIVNIALEVRDRRSFLLRRNLPLTHLGPFWTKADVWSTYCLSVFRRITGV